MGRILPTLLHNALFTPCIALVNYNYHFAYVLVHTELEPEIKEEQVQGVWWSTSDKLR
jgi:hypothetical protein